MPANEQLVELARHGTTMALFLSVRRPRELQAELLEGGYARRHAVRGGLPRHAGPTRSSSAARSASSRRPIREAKITTQALVIVGPALDDAATAGALARLRPRLRPPLPPARPPRPLPREGGAMEQAELREPNLPASARRVATGKLRQRLDDRHVRDRRGQGRVPAAARRRGARRRSRSRCSRASSARASRSSAASPTATRAVAVVVKDAGDDPDVTHGAHLTARVELRDAPGTRAARRRRRRHRDQARGSGSRSAARRSTPGPRRRSRPPWREVDRPRPRSARWSSSASPAARRWPRRTSNPRLGIVGGISILGTTGIVRPFSTAAWRASVGQAIDVMDAQGERTRRADHRRAQRDAPPGGCCPTCPRCASSRSATSPATRSSARAALALERCVFVGMVGKLSKLGAGVLMTHWTRSQGRPRVPRRADRRGRRRTTTWSRRWARPTARATPTSCGRPRASTAAPDLLCAKVAANLRAYVEEPHRGRRDHGRLRGRACGRREPGRARARRARRRCRDRRARRRRRGAPGRRAPSCLARATLVAGGRRHLDALAPPRRRRRSRSARALEPALDALARPRRPRVRAGQRRPWLLRHRPRAGGARRRRPPRRAPGAVVGGRRLRPPGPRVGRRARGQRPRPRPARRAGRRPAPPEGGDPHRAGRAARVVRAAAGRQRARAGGGRAPRRGRRAHGPRHARGARARDLRRAQRARSSSTPRAPATGARGCGRRARRPAGPCPTTPSSTAPGW